MRRSETRDFQNDNVTPSVSVTLRHPERNMQICFIHIKTAALTGYERSNKSNDPLLYGPTGSQPGRIQVLASSPFAHPELRVLI